MKKSIVTSMALCVLLVFTTEAEVPQLINYQGVLSDSAGAPLDGTFDITFKLYSQPVAGTEFWPETHSGAAVHAGLFAVRIAVLLSRLQTDLYWGHRPCCIQEYTSHLRHQPTPAAE